MLCRNAHAAGAAGLEMPMLSKNGNGYLFIDKVENKQSAKSRDAPSYREPETEFVPQMFVPENGQSWQRVGRLLFQALRALALIRT